MEFTTFGALVGLIGGIVGGGGLTDTVNTMVSGAQGMMSSVLRILTSGILAGALIKTGSAEKIADIIVKKLGQRFALVSVAVATMIICAVGVFVDISVITVAPIAMVTAADLEQTSDKKLPSFAAALAGPLAVILLLALRPLAGISVDPLIALPVGGVICMLTCGQIKNIISYVEFGLSKVAGVSILLVGTGTLAGIIKASSIQYDMIALLEAGNLPASWFLLPCHRRICEYADQRTDEADSL